LLRLMLNAHPEVALPLESHFMYQIAKLRARGQWPGSLATQDGLARFRAFLGRHYYFSLWNMDREPLWERIEHLRERTHASVFGAVFTEYMTQQGKRRWGDKTPRQVLFLLLIHRLFPDAKFVQVLRDGRDVALSLVGAPWGPRYLALAGYYWKWAVLSGKVAGALLGPERYREVRYEDLVTDPDPVLRSLCAWLDLPFTPGLLDYHRTPAAAEYARQSAASRRVSTPPDRRRVGRWITEMSPRAQQRLLRQAGGLLAHLGYPVERLPARQAREMERLETLLGPEGIASMDRAAQPHAGAESQLRRALGLDRLVQLTAFASGNLARWATAGARWQRTVAGMLG
jgi:hypothetical protein